MKLTLSPVDDRQKMPFVIEISENPRIEAEIVIGRTRECDIRIPQRSVSRRHCGIMVDMTDRSVRICDFESENGTFVNDEPVTELREIVNGDKVTVGFLPLRLEISEDISEDVSVWNRIDALAHHGPVGEPRKMVVGSTDGR